MTTPQHAAIDTNVLVALVDSRDHWHASAHALQEALQGRGADLVYFDPVLNEAISVLARRALERGRSSQFADLLDTLTHQVPPEAITWLSAETQRLYSRVCWRAWRSGHTQLPTTPTAQSCRVKTTTSPGCGSDAR